MSDVDPMQQFPVPAPDADTEAFWAGVAREELLVQRCDGCQASEAGESWIWPPRPVCPRCQTPDPPWQQVSGDGEIVSWVVLRPPVLPAYVDMVPFVVLLVEFDESQFGRALS